MSLERQVAVGKSVHILFEFRHGFVADLGIAVEAAVVAVGNRMLDCKLYARQ